MREWYADMLRAMGDSGKVTYVDLLSNAHALGVPEPKKVLSAMEHEGIVKRRVVASPDGAKLYIETAE